MDKGFPGSARGKEPPCQCRRWQEMWVQSLSWEDPLEEGMAAHSTSCLENPMDRGAWQATAHGVTHKESDTAEATEHSIIAVTHLVSIGML